MTCSRRWLLPTLAGYCAATVLAGHVAAAQEKQVSDGEIRRLIVQESIAAYSGACPCPESRKQNGDRCGKSSAYSRDGGDRPLCYPSNVSDAAVQRYRERMRKQ